MLTINWFQDWRKARRRNRRRAEERRLLELLGNVDGEPAGAVEGLVVTVVLGGKPDPLRPQRTLADFGRYIRPWWNSVHRVGLHGVVLHDVLTEEFVAAHDSPLVTFVRVAPRDWPLYHERHRLVRDYLQRIHDEFVLITDVSDVAFRRNPFAVLQAACEDQFAVGSEPLLIGESRFMREEMERQFGEVFHSDKTVLNPGILGGRRTRVLAILEEFVAEIAAQAPRLVGTDMSLFNKAIYDRHSPAEWVTGHPLHSRFRGWEFETTAAVIHK